MGMKVVNIERSTMSSTPGGSIGAYRLHLLILVLALCMPELAAGYELPATPGGPQDISSVIQQDFDHGLISFDEKARLQLIALVNPSELPARYSAESAGLIRCATPMLLEILDNEEKLSQETRGLLKDVMDRPERQTSLESPFGFFRLHYDTTGPQMVPTLDLDSNGVPDLVDKCAAYLDTSRVKHLSWGYMLPAADSGMGGDDLYDVYFALISAYGFMAPDGDGPEPWNDGISHLILHNTFLGFPPNDDPEGDQAGTAKVVCAHEFHHAIQRSYDRDEALWFVEMDAVHMEEIIFPQVNDNFIYFDEFFNNPAKALTATSANHLYATFPFGIYMAKKFDTVLFRQAWEGAKYGGQVFTALADSLQANHGWTRDSAVAEFWVWNYITNTRDDGNHYDDGALYPLIFVTTEHTSFPVDTVQAATAPEGYGASYIRFRRLFGVNGTLRVQFNGADATDWAVWILTTTPTMDHAYVRMPIDPSTRVGTFDVPSFQNYQTVTMVVVNLNEFSSASTFEYGAHIPSGYDVNLQRATVDSAIYYLGGRNWTYQVQNPSNKNALYNFSYYDDSGWVAPDTVAVAVPMFGSTNVAIPANPVAGTPIGSRSQLHVNAVAQTDPYVFDTDDCSMEIVLQYGDLDYTGQITLGDLTVMIDHLFISLAPLSPYPHAGNFDCSPDSAASLGDLTALVNYLFIDIGANSPCNPY